MSPWLSGLKNPLMFPTDKGPGERLLMKDVQDIVRAEPEGTWSPEQLKQLKIDYEAHQLAQESGTRLSNAAAAKDVTYTGDRIFEEVSRSVESMEDTDYHCVFYSSYFCWRSARGHLPSWSSLALTLTIVSAPPSLARLPLANSFRHSSRCPQPLSRSSSIVGLV